MQEWKSDLYERLQSRLALALDKARTEELLRKNAPQELELNGLTDAELAFVQAYVNGDQRWLSGWHAAAEELAHLELRSSRSQRPGKLFRRSGKRYS